MTVNHGLDLPAPPALSSTDQVALFLDLDGTLAAIEPRPQDVKPEQWRSGLLRRLLAHLDGRVAVVSGRTLEDIDRIIEGAVAPVAAVHGLIRRRADGAVMRPLPHPQLGRARIQATAFALKHPGVELEDKVLSLALHYRRAPELAETVKQAAETMARSNGQSLQLGDMVAEIRTPGFDKGSAVEAFMNEPPFQGAVPIFVGDDLTDEDGFHAAQSLGGLGVLAGPPRPTEARYRLADVAAVRRWLEGAIAERAVS